MLNLIRPLSLRLTTLTQIRSYYHPANHNHPKIQYSSTGKEKTLVWKAFMKVDLYSLEQGQIINKYICGEGWSKKDARGAVLIAVNKELQKVAEDRLALEKEQKKEREEAEENEQ